MGIREDIIKSWMEKAKKIYQIRNGLGGKFQFADMLVSCWITFEAFTCKKYNKEYVNERLKAFWRGFQNKYSAGFNNFPDDFKENITLLSGCNVRDMRPNHGLDIPKEITDVKNLEQVMKLIYQVRNNLFHGGKNVDEENDKLIIQYSAIVLYRILEKFLSEENYLS